jgi:hypothetical protein
MPSRTRQWGRRFMEASPELPGRWRICANHFSIWIKTRPKRLMRRCEIILVADPWRDDYDLIGGLVGYGVYALEQLPGKLAIECLAQVVNRFDEMAERTAQGTTWFTAPELLSDWQREICPKGHYNLGLAHGVPGVIAFLGRVYALNRKIPRAVFAPLKKKARGLLNGAVSWRLA